MTVLATIKTLLWIVTVLIAYNKGRASGDREHAGIVAAAIKATKSV